MSIERGTHFPIDFLYHRRLFIRAPIADALDNLAETATESPASAARQLLALIDRETKQNRDPAKFMALGVLHEIYSSLQRDYLKDIQTSLVEIFNTHLPLLAEFLYQYPVPEVRQRLTTIDEYLKLTSADTDALQETLGDYLFLQIQEKNPAAFPFSDLFSSPILKKQKRFQDFNENLFSLLRKFPGPLPSYPPLPEFLQLPIDASPNNFFGQLEYIFRHWKDLLPKHLLLQLLRSLDLMRESQTHVADFSSEIDLRLPDFSDPSTFPESEAFTQDRDWMPRVTLMAKSTYVWLYQLSKKYRREIHRLDEIPDEELECLSAWGFTALWLIGLWQRSPASANIKKICGNENAISSAYSIYEYKIADDLGGDDAWQNLKSRAATFGIRLAADMVPNHMGIYSKWIIEKPDLFLSLPYSPYPAYRFDGPDLGAESGLEIKIEDGYYSKTDAAVVFRRIDHRLNDTRYIYHGNDGTSMPWNDTAQLDYLNPEAREAIIQEIISMAKKFQIIRFDAAMTLAKKHIRRLWHPNPGDGGAIPSRAEHAKNNQDFENAIPNEFWREVVDRVNQEVPDTLLLAEAFWMMEGYFVRTLGMHRVYNSAFMNMLKAEENQKYRTYIKGTLEFNPEILRRYVNFMSNPDEETAIAQFSKGDKYFGVTTLLVTMPGLPLWGHGQVEGYREKYGMEYNRSYYEEFPDHWLIERHEREIFPLMRKRHLFAGVEHFYLFDFILSSGEVNENVFAYTNRSGAERALIIYNNSYSQTAGTVFESVNINVGTQDGQKLQRAKLHRALGLRQSPDSYLIFKDARTSQEYIRRLDQLAKEGLFVMLDGYGLHAFVDMREVTDKKGWLGKLCDNLKGAPVPSIEEALKEIQLEPLTEPLKNYISFTLIAEMISVIAPHIDESKAEKNANQAIKEIFDNFTFYKRYEQGNLAVLPFSEKKGYTALSKNQILTKTTEFVNAMRKMQPKFLGDLNNDVKEYLLLQYSKRNLDYPYEFWRIPVTVFLCSLLTPAARNDMIYRALMPILKRKLEKLGAHESQANWEASLIITLLEMTNEDKVCHLKNDRQWLDFFASERVRKFINVHLHNNVLYFHKESCELLLYWVSFFQIIYYLQNPFAPDAIPNLIARVNNITASMAESKYQYHDWLSIFYTDSVLHETHEAHEMENNRDKENQTIKKTSAQQREKTKKKEK